MHNENRLFRACSYQCLARCCPVNKMMINRCLCMFDVLTSICQCPQETIIKAIFVIFHFVIKLLCACTGFAFNMSVETSDIQQKTEIWYCYTLYIHILIMSWIKLEKQSYYEKCIIFQLLVSQNWRTVMQGIQKLITLIENTLICPFRLIRTLYKISHLTE